MMRTMKSKLTPLIAFLTVILGIPLLLSVIASGYRYQFDSDELHHAHLTYLYLTGYQPYRDIYNSVYTPIFELILLPLFRFYGFTFAAIYASRALMIALFVLRIAISFLLAATVFGRGVALLFVLLFLLDPFVIFSSMQIRPDNLMVLLWTFGLLIFTRGLFSMKKLPFFLSGVVIGFAGLTLLKIVPSIIVFVVLLTMFAYIKKLWSQCMLLVLGIFMATAAFFSYFLLAGDIGEVIKQLILEVHTAYSVFRIPVPLGNFYLPNNIYIFGFPGQPLTWVYVWVLPLLAAAGAYQSIITVLTRHGESKKDLIVFVLIASGVTQWALLFFSPVVFIQHYLPVSWLFSLFAAVAMTRLLEATKSFPHLRSFTVSLVTIGIVSVGISSIRANFRRSEMDSTRIIAKYQMYWSKIPESALVFPHFLFRPPVYPVPYGYFIGNVPAEIFARLPDIPSVLEKKKVPFLFLSDYAFGLLPKTARDYMSTHYERVAGDEELWRRTKESIRS